MSEKYLDIPEDCWELIFDHFPNQTHFESLSLVSKHFLHLTTLLPHKLSITDTLIQTHTQISKLINKRFPNLTSISFINYTGNIDALLLNIANSCPLEKLVEIDVSNGNNIPIMGLKELGGKIRVLKCRNLRVLRDDDLFGIANSLSLLEELDVSYPGKKFDLSERSSRDATEMSLTDFGIRVLVMSVRSLRRINVSGNRLVTDRSLVCLAENCEFLEGVDVAGCTLITAKGFLFLLRNCVHLNSVSVSGIEIQKGSLGSEDNSCVGKRLFVIHNSSISDEFMQLLVGTSVDLTRLSLFKCTEFTVSSLALLLHSCHSLQHLSLCEIDFLTEEYIVQISPYLHNLVSLNLSGVPLLAFSTFHKVAKSCPANYQNLRYLELLLPL